MTELGCLAGDLESNSQWRQEQYRPPCACGPDRPTPTPSASYPSRSRRRSRRVLTDSPLDQQPLEVEQMPRQIVRPKPPALASCAFAARNSSYVVTRHLLRSLARPTRADDIGLERPAAALAEQHDTVLNGNQAQPLGRENGCDGWSVEMGPGHHPFENGFSV